MSSEKGLWDESEERLVAFLLGRLPEAEQEEIENRIVAEDGFLEEVLATGDELSRAYLNERLSTEDRARFQTHFLAVPRQRRRFEELRDLAAAMRQPPRTRARAVPVWALAAAAVLFVVIGVWIWQAGKSQPPRETIVHHTPTPVSPAPTPGETTPRVRLPEKPSGATEIPLTAETRQVRLEVPIDDDRHPTFDASLRTPDGKTVWEKTEILAPGPGAAIVLTVPAEILAAADSYSLLIEGEKLRDPRHKRVSITYTLRVARSR